MCMCKGVCVRVCKGVCVLMCKGVCVRMCKGLCVRVRCAGLDHFPLTCTYHPSPDDMRRMTEEKPLVNPPLFQDYLNPPLFQAIPHSFKSK